VLGDLTHELVVAHELLGGTALVYEDLFEQREEVLVGQARVLDRFC
jgi:hypothetical protein